jgi:hypothetical protein
MEFSHFTYIAGIASLLGFALQLFNVFPKYSGFRKSIFLLILGIFLGTLINTFNTSHVTFDVKISGFSILITVFALTIIGLLVAGAMMQNPRRREELFTICSFGFMGFLCVLFMGSLFSGNVKTATMEKEQLTISEFIELADYAEKRGDFDRAIMHLESLKNRLEANDLRQKKIKERIEQAKRRQIE